MQPKPRPVLKAASAFIGVHRRVTANRPHYWEASSCHRHCVGAPTATGTASNVGACVSLLQLPPSLQTATNCQRPPWQGRIAVRQSRQQNRLTCRRVENRPAGGWSCFYRYIYRLNIFRSWAPSFSPAVNTAAWLHVTQRSAVGPRFASDKRPITVSVLSFFGSEADFRRAITTPKRAYRASGTPGLNLHAFLYMGRHVSSAAVS